MILSELKLGDKVHILFGARGTGTFIAKIGAGCKPNADDVLKWYGDAAPVPASAFRALNVDRYIFQRTNKTHVIVPDSHTANFMLDWLDEDS